MYTLPSMVHGALVDDQIHTNSKIYEDTLRVNNVCDVKESAVVVCV